MCTHSYRQRVPSVHSVTGRGENKRNGPTVSAALGALALPSTWGSWCERGPQSQRDRSDNPKRDISTHLSVNEQPHLQTPLSSIQRLPPPFRSKEAD